MKFGFFAAAVAAALFARPISAAAGETGLAIPLPGLHDPTVTEITVVVQPASGHVSPQLSADGRVLLAVDDPTEVASFSYVAQDPVNGTSSFNEVLADPFTGVAITTGAATGATFAVNFVQQSSPDDEPGIHFVPNKGTTEKDIEEAKKVHDRLKKTAKGRVLELVLAAERDGTTFKVDSGNPNINFGGFATGTLDIDDLLDVGEGVGPTTESCYLHELKEQHTFQNCGKDRLAPGVFKEAHEEAIELEEEYISTKDGDRVEINPVPGIRPNGLFPDEYFVFEYPGIDQKFALVLQHHDPKDPTVTTGIIKLPPEAHKPYPKPADDPGKPGDGSE